jgi:hypothetical protein
MFLLTGSKNHKIKEKSLLKNRNGKKYLSKLKVNSSVIIVTELDKTKTVKKIKKPKIKTLDGQLATVRSNS